MRRISRERWDLAGEAAYLLEPNLKESRGGLRDAQALHALAAAQLVDFPVRVREAYPVLLDVRGELQRLTGRGDDVLRQQEYDAVAAATGLAGDDARDVLLRHVNEAARAISHALDAAWRRIEASQSHTPRRRLFGASRPVIERVGLARNVVAQGGEVMLARDADPWADPGLVLRVARAAAERDCPSPRSPSSGWPPSRRRWPRRGRGPRSMTSCPARPPARPRSPCSRRWTRPACWSA